MKAWRDVNSDRWTLGLKFWRSGGEAYLGYNLFRWRYGK